MFPWRFAATFLAIAVITSGFALYFASSSLTTNEKMTQSSLTAGAIFSSPIPKDIVTVTVHDKYGKLVEQQTTHNIITTAGAALICAEANICPLTVISNPAPTVVAQTYWVAFINGSAANVNEPTAQDCTMASNANLAGNVVGSGAATRCVALFGSAPAQFPLPRSTDFVVSLGTAGAVVQLKQPAATVDAVNNYTQTSKAFTVCTPEVNGTAPTSGTCQMNLQTQVFTYNLATGKLNIVGLLLNAGTNSAVTAGPYVVAEASITPVSLNPGDTIQVTWQIVV